MPIPIKESAFSISVLRIFLCVLYNLQYTFGTFAISLYDLQFPFLSVFGNFALLKCLYNKLALEQVC